ncbi:MAG: PKD domain-containing protein [Chloroflexi bacterium]|nr:PKD domain-containing protein [Chloroflexota bacterium]
MQELRFDEVIFGQVPINVAYEISGPVTTAGAPTNWINIDDALRDKDTATWLLKWDTVNFGIENGWYLLRPVVEVNSSMQQSLQSVTLDPVMLLIDNVSPNMYTLQLNTPVGDVHPGDTISIGVSFVNQGLQTLKNARMGIILDHQALQFPDNANLVTTKSSVQSGEQWTAVFSLPLTEQDGEPEPLHIQAFVSSDEYAYLTGTPLIIDILPRAVVINGRVVDTLGRGLDAQVVLTDGQTEWEADTDQNGQYQFINVSAGDYEIMIDPIPEGYTYAIPEGGTYPITAQGYDSTRMFMLTRLDRLAPSVSTELPWNDVVQYGRLYGLAYDNPFGSGLQNVILAVHNEATDQWLDNNGQWTNDETWIQPDATTSLDEFINERLDDLLEPLPENKRDAEREQLSSIRGLFTERTSSLVWDYTFSDTSFMSDSAVVVLVKASDQAGFEGMVELYDSSMSVDFVAAPTSDSEPLTMMFDSQTTGIASDFTWDFGDGEYSIYPDTTHTYDSPGIYQVTLSVEGPHATAHITKEIAVGIYQIFLPIIRGP